jgi:hypothetical protein
MVDSFMGQKINWLCAIILIPMQAREERKVRKVMMAAVGAIEKRDRVAASILNVFSDREYNR